MYTKHVKVAKSDIDGKGVFTTENIKKGDIVWLFKEGYDRTATNDELQQLSREDRERLSHTSYLSPWSKLWVFPPINDPAEYTNHSSTNNLTVQFDSSISSEPYFIANKDIIAGSELTNNYHEFDEITRSIKPDWLA